MELEDDMLICPLCGVSVNNSAEAVVSRSAGPYPKPAASKKQRKFTWDIVSLILGSGIIAAFIVDFIISRSITWSEYTTAVGLVIFCYVSVFAFLNIGIPGKMAVGFVLTSVCFLLLDVVTGGITWAIRLAIPLLLCVNIIVIGYIQLMGAVRHQGLNLIAYAFLAAALICICVEGVMSFFIHDEWRLHWSVIVSACVVPVVLALLFAHYRLRKGQNLKRTFHV